MILVTGAAGLNGSTIMREFAAQKTRVRALVRSRAQARVLDALPTVERVEGDMLKPDTLGAAPARGRTSAPDLFGQSADGRDTVHLH
jgi:uncharacterized protein YbjT (DUF2867 family)